MRNLTYFLFIMSLIFTSSCSAQNQVDNSKIISAVERYLDKCEVQGFDGSVLVDYHGQKLLSKGYGHSNKAEGIRNSSSTIFDIGSITKQFTAAAILKLEMQGQLKVSDNISKYFDNVPDNRKEVTLHHLLTHTAGFPGGIGDDYDAISEKEFIDDALNSDIKAAVGLEYNYSNVGYSLLTLIIEKVSGMTYEKYLNENLFTPAGMSHTGYVLPNWNNKYIAVGYRGKDRKWGKPNEKNWATDGPYLNLKGNGGILSTVEDMYLWHMALLTDNILDADAKKKYYKKHIEEGEGAGSYYGYGWAIYPTPRNTELITHNGGNGVFFADFWRYLDEEVTIVIMTNRVKPQYENLASDIGRIIRNPDEEIKIEKQVNSMEVPGDQINAFGNYVFNTLANGTQADWKKLIEERCSEEFQNMGPLETHYKIIDKFSNKYKNGNIVNINIQENEIFLNFIKDQTKGELSISYELNDQNQLIVSGLRVED